MRPLSLPTTGGEAGVRGVQAQVLPTDRRLLTGAAMAPDASGSRQELSGAVKRGRAAGTPTGKHKRLEDAALAALLSQPTLAQAAQQAGISESTMLPWLADPAFKARYREARRQVVELAVTNLQQATAAAVETLTRN